MMVEDALPLALGVSGRGRALRDVPTPVEDDPVPNISANSEKRMSRSAM